jgi:hypothetical protein
MSLEHPFPDLDQYPEDFQQAMTVYDQMTDQEVEALVLKNLNNLRAQVGGVPFDHVPTTEEVDAWWDAQHPKRTRYQEFRYRLHRAWLALVAPEEL